MTYQPIQHIPNMFIWSVSHWRKWTTVKLFKPQHISANRRIGDIMVDKQWLPICSLSWYPFSWQNLPCCLRSTNLPVLVLNLPTWGRSSRYKWICFTIAIRLHQLSPNLLWIVANSCTSWSIVYPLILLQCLIVTNGSQFRNHPQYDNWEHYHSFTRKDDPGTPKTSPAFPPTDRTSAPRGDHKGSPRQWQRLLQRSHRAFCGGFHGDLLGFNGIYDII